jgi:hypothetical protein
MRRAVIVIVAGLTAACGGGPPAAAPTTASASGSASASAALPEVAGIEAEIVRLRTDEAVGGQVQVRITDTGDDPFTVTSVALESAGFASLPPTGVTAEFAPGRTIDLPVPYGAAVCDAAPEPAGARLTVLRPGGASEELRVPAEAEVLGRIHEKECAVRAVAEVVEVAVTGLQPDGDALRGAITLTRRTGGEPVTVRRLGRSVLIEATAEDLPAELAGNASTVSTPVSFTPATCDPHVLAETKKPYVFPLELTVGGGAPVVMDLPVDQTARDQFAALVERVC